MSPHIGEEGDTASELQEPLSAASTTSEWDTPLRDTSDPPSLRHGKSPTPSTEDSTSLDALTEAISPRASESSTHRRTTSNKRLPVLTNDLKLALTYARTKLGTQHYGFKYHDSPFLRNTLIEVALRFEPLLYAVAGFAAYHHTLSKSSGRIGDFLAFYTKSVSSLRVSLKETQKPSVGTLLTVLQLATIEVR